MARTALVGTRIRERRLQLGIRQAGLAEMVGISPSYLNLIEHNRRKIGGKVLVELAQALDVDSTTLLEGADTQILDALRLAATGQGDVSHDMAGLEDMARKHPAWANLIKDQHERIQTLEHTIAGLSDRLAHDPFLSESLHEILSTVTAIRSTASILSEPGEMDLNWQRRFHDNIFKDSKRLAEASRNLAQYLDAEAEEAVDNFGPQDEFEQCIAAHDYHLPMLEAGALDHARFEAEILRNLSAPAAEIARSYAQKYVADAQKLPLAQLQNAVAHHGVDPTRLFDVLGVDVPVLLRRLASLPPAPNVPKMGLVISDGAGKLLYRQPCAGFNVPRVGAACSVWPVFAALSQPMVPLHRVLRHTSGAQNNAEEGANLFDAYCIAQPRGAQSFNAHPSFEATMLLVARNADSPALQVADVGTTCRICPLAECAARSEPSVLAEEI